MGKLTTKSGDYFEAAFENGKKNGSFRTKLAIDNKYRDNVLYLEDVLTSGEGFIHFNNQITFLGTFEDRLPTLKPPFKFVYDSETSYS